jgi:hypothetical protein
MGIFSWIILGLIAGNGPPQCMKGGSSKRLRKRKGG